MGRPGLKRGESTEVSEGRKLRDGVWTAWARYAPLDGGTPKVIERRARTKTAAQRAVRAALDALKDEPGRTGLVLDQRSTVAQAWADYEAEVLADKAPSSQRVYRVVWTKHLEPALGKVKLSEVTEADAASLMRKVAMEAGPGAAKTARTVLLGVIEQARARGAVKVNVVRGSRRPDGGKAREAKAERDAAKRAEDAAVAVLRDKDRPLTETETTALEALEGDTADLIAFMLGTGARLGEACAVQWDAVNLDAETVAIVATVTKDKDGKSVRSDKTKTKAGARVIHISARLANRLLARRVDAGTSPLVFPSEAGTVRDLRNTDRQIRKVLDAQGLTWATSHTFRRTVATRLLVANVDPVQVAKVLGHAMASLTLDVYGKRDETAQVRTADLL